MNTAIEITPSNRDRGRVVRIWTKTHATALRLKKKTRIPMAEIFDLAIAQLVVIGQKREAK